MLTEKKILFVILRALGDSVTGDSFLISNFHCALYVVCFLLGNSPASEFSMPMFQNSLSERSETLAYKIQPPGNYPEESIQQGTPCLPDLNSCNFYFWGILKDNIFINNPCTEDHLKEKHSVTFMCVIPIVCVTNKRG